VRIAIAEISQETDTFSLLPSDITDFESSTFLSGQDMLERNANEGVVGGARSFFAGKSDVELVPLLHASAVAGGTLTHAAFQELQRRLLAALAACQPIDGLLLSLHGATVSERVDDVSGQILLAARRAVGQRVRIVVPLDHHANVTRLIVETADMVVGFETQPHEPFSTGLTAARHLYGLVRDGLSPVRAWAKVPMIAPQDRFLTSQGPMREWSLMARRIEEEENVLSASVFPMQPWLDAAEGGWTAVVYARGDGERARTCADRLAAEAWRLRHEFWISERQPVARAVREAIAAPRGLVLLSDMGDAVYGGAPGDSTSILRELLAQGVPCLAYLSLFDPPAVARASAAGLGQLTLTLGGRYDPFSRPLEVAGRVTAISHGLQTVTQGRSISTGKAVLFETGNVRVAITANRNASVIMPILYTHLGLDIDTAKIVVLKTGSNFQYFERWRRSLIRVDSPGATQSDLASFAWTKLPRPVFPLDDLRDWQPSSGIV
jgi:microcystin degradation protein MlrC